MRQGRGNSIALNPGFVPSRDASRQYLAGGFQPCGLLACGLAGSRARRGVRLRHGRSTLCTGILLRSGGGVCACAADGDEQECCEGQQQAVGSHADEGAGASHLLSSLARVVSQLVPARSDPGTLAPTIRQQPCATAAVGPGANWRQGKPVKAGKTPNAGRRKLGGRGVGGDVGWEAGFGVVHPHEGATLSEMTDEQQGNFE